jgi:hypothetical protein
LSRTAGRSGTEIFLTQICSGYAPRRVSYIVADVVSNFHAFGGHPLSPPAPPAWLPEGMIDSAGPEKTGVSARDAAAKIRTGIICNPKSHRNRSSVEATKPFLSGTVMAVTPRTQAELAEVLTDFARHGIELLVIDGGDGTIRDVMTAAARVWTGAAPRVAIVPSGKTNALALDLGIPDDWTLDQALTAARGGNVKIRHPIEVVRKDSGTRLHGFLLGAGAFVDATALAQRTHRAGAFNGVAAASRCAGRSSRPCSAARTVLGARATGCVSGSARVATKAFTRPARTPIPIVHAISCSPRR